MTPDDHRIAMTAKEITTKIKLLHCQRAAFDLAPKTRDPRLWEQELNRGIILHVRREPNQYFGVFYRVCATRRNRILAMLFAMKPKTAGKKARSLITKYGGAS